MSGSVEWRYVVKPIRQEVSGRGEKGGTHLIAIYVMKKWIETVGAASDLLFIDSESKSDHAILFADDKKLDAGYPFVYAEGMRHPSTVSTKKKAFIPVWIPTSEVVAIFDFTEADSAKMGFLK